MPTGLHLGEGTLLAFDAPERVFREDLLTRAYGALIVVREDDGVLLAFAKPPERRRKENGNGQHLDPQG